MGWLEGTAEGTGAGTVCCGVGGAAVGVGIAVGVNVGLGFWVAVGCGFGVGTQVAHGAGVGVALLQCVVGQGVCPGVGPGCGLPTLMPSTSSAAIMNATAPPNKPLSLLVTVFSPLPVVNAVVQPHYALHLALLVPEEPYES